MYELEKAYQILLDYEKEVKKFLLYVCGYHPNIEKDNWASKCNEQLDTLRKKRDYSYNIFMITSSLYSKQLTTNEKQLVDHYNDNAISISRNISCWFNSVNTILKQYPQQQ